MNRLCRFLILIPFLIISFRSAGQTDTDRPVSPVFTFLSVQPLTGKTELQWTKSPSPDVAGYVIYNFRNGEGFAFDTLRDPNAVSYVNMGAFAGDRSESYVVAAIDSAGNISPLSNELHTIFAQARIDTCKKIINISWNSYPSVPKSVSLYRIMVSEDGGTYYEAGSVTPDKTSFTTGSFKSGSRYCFIIFAELAGGFVSKSNQVCLTATMQRAPLWINADQATVNDDSTISLSYTIDPLSQIRSFGLDRMKENDTGFVRLAALQSVGGNVTYTDRSAKPGQKYIYRLAAINNCGNPVVFSGISTNIVLRLTLSEGKVILQWNKYREWEGSVDHYTVLLNTGNGFMEKAMLPESDSSFILSYTDIMYQISATSYCFRVEAFEGSNPHGISGISRSDIACGDAQEIITVPNAFTPDNDMINDRFRPVLSFTPLDYTLIITDRKNNKVFETRNPSEEWDGTNGGSLLPEDVYLWFLKVKTPSGKFVSRTGTVTIIKNR